MRQSSSQGMQNSRICIQTWKGPAKPRRPSPHSIMGFRINTEFLVIELGRQANIVCAQASAMCRIS